jgi:hypothetical protein
VQDAIAQPLAAWESFFVIVGSSGAALTGLQFVVIALVAESRKRSTLREIDAFGTPTIVHFCAALLVAAVMSAPWHEVSSAAVALDACGAAGVGYVAIVARRARRQTGYSPVLEDWIWHVALPIIAYGMLLFASLTVALHVTAALFIIAAMSLLLLFIGIHNAWDTVTYIAIDRAEQEKEDGQQSSTKTKTAG